jgi:hypothetical protein
MTERLATIAPPSEDEFHHEPAAGVGTGEDDADLAWQERAYFTMHDPSGIGMDFGFGRHPMAGDGGAYSAYACLNTGERQVNVRAKGPLSEREGTPQPSPFTVEMVEQGRVWRVGLEHELLSMDLLFEGRTGLGLLPKARIDGGKGNAASTDVIFQSGRYTGEVRTAEGTIAVDGWAGARDRTWGYRKHEGRLPSGLLCAIILEFEAEEMILWKVERRTGEEVMRAGMRLGVDGGITTVHEWSVALSIDAAIGAVEGAELTVEGDRFDLTPTGSAVYLAGGGYLAKGRHGSAADAAEAEGETWNLSSDEGQAAVTGLDDHVVRVSGAAEGSGILELQVGRHERFLPDGWTSAEEGLGIEALRV